MIYFVETPAREQRETLCRWVERFYEEGKKVQVTVNSSQAAQHLDRMLWTFSEGSFIPHRTVNPRSMEPVEVPVVVIVGEVYMEGFEVLVCDAPGQVDFMMRYPVAVHFILRDDEEKRQESRLLWQSARDRGVELHHVPYTPISRR